MTKIYEEALGLQEELTALRHYLHQHPEVGRDLPRTAAKVRETLERLGVDFEELIPNGFVARIGRGAGKRILLRADIDALPMKESTGLPFASLNPGAMHSCGHDTHASMLLGAAMLLKRREDELQGQAILMFQPDEEGLTGAKAMIDAGLLRDKPDYAVAMHIWSSDSQETGTISLNYDTCMASSDRFQVTVTGRGGHGALPHRCQNPIYPAIKMIDGLTDLGRYEIDAQLPNVLTVCQLEAGSAPNIIPDQCRFTGTLRMLDEARRAEVLRRMDEVVRGVAAAYGVEGRLVITGSVPSVKNDNQLTDRVHGWLSAAPEAKVGPIGRSVDMGSEDFSYLSQLIPSCYMGIWSRSPQGRHYPGHNERVEFDDQALWQGAAAYAQIAAQYLK